MRVLLPEGHDSETRSPHRELVFRPRDVPSATPGGERMPGAWMHAPVAHADGSRHTPVTPRTRPRLGVAQGPWFGPVRRTDAASTPAATGTPRSGRKDRPCPAGPGRLTTPGRGHPTRSPSSTGVLAALSSVARVRPAGERYAASRTHAPTCLRPARPAPRRTAPAVRPDPAPPPVRGSPEPRPPGWGCPVPSGRASGGPPRGSRPGPRRGGPSARTARRGRAARGPP